MSGKFQIYFDTNSRVVLYSFYHMYIKSSCQSIVAFGIIVTYSLVWLYFVQKITHL